jgi:hypothetical protein
MNTAVRALGVYDDGAGPALYAGGNFTSAGGAAANYIARWDGSSWSALGAGVAANQIAKWDGSSWSALGSGASGGMNPDVSALIVHDDGSGPALYAGGGFTVTDSGDSHVAKLGCSDSSPPVISCPPPILAPDRLLDGEEVVYFTVTATDDADPAPVVACVPPSGSTFPLGATLVTCTATDCSGNQSTCQFTVTLAPKVRRR